MLVALLASDAVVCLEGHGVLQLLPQWVQVTWSLHPFLSFLANENIIVN